LASKNKPTAFRLEALLTEASWLLSHAEALSTYGRTEEAAREWERAAVLEDEVASWLDSAGREVEAAVHRVSAASCFERLEERVRAVTLLRAALSAKLPADYRARVETQLARLLARAARQGKQSQE
jgi:hypothetical protein